MSDKSEYRIRALIERREKEYAQIKEVLAKHGKAFDDVIVATPTAAITSTGVDYVGLNIYASGDRHDLAGCVRALRTNGFSTDTKPPEKKAATWAAMFYNEDRACIYLSFTSRVCRRVKVGTKMVEQDVYETVCDEIIIPEQAA